MNTIKTITSTTRRRPGRPKTGMTVDGKERLLHSAIATFGKQGFESSGLRTIAENAGVDPAMVAHYFGSKVQLWQSAVDNIACRQECLLPLLSATVQSPHSLYVRLHEAINCFIDLAARQRDMFRFFARELNTPGWRLEYLTRRVAEPCYAICAPLWQEAIDTGALASPHPAVFHILLLGALASTLNAAPMIAQLAGYEVDRATIMRALQHILQGHFPDTKT